MPLQLFATAALMFDEVARSGSIRKASERLNISASAINRQILNLEQDAGLPLFERLPRGVRPTAAGELILAEVRRWRREQSRMQGQLKDMTGLRRGLVRIGAMECFATAILPQAFATFRAQHTLVAIDLHLGGTDDLLAKLARNEIDLVLCFNPPARAQVTVLMQADFVPGIVMAADHPLTARETVTLADCRDFPFVQPDRSLPLRNLIDQAFARAGISLPVVTTTNSVSAIKGLVSSGENVSVLSRIDIHAELARGDLAWRPLEGTHLPQETLVLCMQHGHRPGPQTLAVAEVIKEALRETVSA